MDKKVYAISKHDDKAIASGFDHALRTGNNTFSVFFTDGSQVDLTIPLPQDGAKGDRGVSISDATFDANGKLVIELEDGTKLSPLTMPSAAVEVSKQTGNIVVQKADGIYAPATDLTNYVQKETGKGLSETNVTATMVSNWNKAEQNVQPDWAQTDTTKDNYIQNKPTIPTVDSAISATSVNAVENKVIKEELDKKVDVAQGVANKDKFLKVGADGNVTLGDVPSGTDIVTTWETTTSDAKVPSEKLVKGEIDGITQELAKKVDKVTGKGLSTNDYDDTEKAQVAKIAGKIDRAQGTVNAGKILVVGSNGNVTLERRDVVSAWETTPVDTNVPSEKLVKDSLDEINADLTAQVELGYLRNKNLVDGILNAVIESSGTITRGSGDKTTVIFYALENTKYTVSGSNRDRSRVVRCTEKPKIGSKGTIVIDSDSTTTFIAPYDGWYAWYMSSTSDSTPQVEKGSVATSYVEPNGKSNVELTKLVNDDLKMLGWTVPSECPIQNYTDSNGVFHQRVGRVDLGSLTWTKPSSEHFFWANFDGCKINGKSYANTSIGTAYIHDKQQKVCFDATDITDVSVLTQSLSGVYLYYELATEITKSVDGNEVAFSQDTWTLLGSINLGTTQTLTFTKPSKYSELLITVYSQTAYYLRWNENLPHTGDYYPLADWGQKVRFGDNASCFEMTIKNGQLVVDIANGINIDLLNDNATTVELFYR